MPVVNVSATETTGTENVEPASPASLSANVPSDAVCVGRIPVQQTAQLNLLRGRTPICAESLAQAL